MEDHNPANTGETVGEDQTNDEIETAQADLNLSATELHAELAQAQEKIQASQDQFLRSAAELENFRKRAARDLEHARKYGIESFAAELLPVRDSLELGLSAAKGNEATLASLQEGTEMTLRLFAQAMEKSGIEQINPVGEQFDPLLHEAMVMVESDAAPNTVVEVVQMGYRINDRLLRPARVVVAKEIEGKSQDTA